MSRTRRVLVALPLLIALIGLAAPALAAATPSTSAHHATAPTLPKYAPVYIHFKPRNATGTPGGSVTVTGIVWNNGSYAYTATGCTLWYRLGSSGTWTKAAACLTSSLFPHTFASHSKTRFSGSQKVASNFPTGVYEWKIQGTGTYNSHTLDSHPGILKVTIT
ncbi:MAG TPA: hypothetical protein VGV89_08335 [Thermoplasmata archaeon]|nr:hypothetical protein [Thermoplasmata archaeon]